MGSATPFEGFERAPTSVEGMWCSSKGVSCGASAADVNTSCLSSFLLRERRRVVRVRLADSLVSTVDTGANATGQIGGYPYVN